MTAHHQTMQHLADEAADDAFYAAVDTLKSANTETLRAISVEGSQNGRTDLVCSAADHVLDQRLHDGEA